MAEAPAGQKGGKAPAAGNRPKRRSTTATGGRSRAAAATPGTGKPAARAPRRTSAPAPAPAEDRGGWLELVTALVQAPVGLGRTQADRLVGELVKTGNLGQREAERLLKELRSASGRAQGRAQSASAGLDRFIESRIEDVLNRVNIPSRSDIERLNRSVDVLTAKVDALLGRRERSTH